MRDFTLDTYRELLETFQDKGYRLVSFADYLKRRAASGRVDERFVILRHDVDARPENSLRTAQIEHAIGAKATYYFRKPNGRVASGEIIRAIVRLGHEIGYHYEDMALCNGDAEKAYAHFQTWLDYFRQFYPVETICMHGAPTSRYDAKDLWLHYDYKALGLIGEPYLDTDFSDVLYLTDTGRCWDGYKVSVRDKVPQFQEEWKAKGWSFHTTEQLLQALSADRLPDRMMLVTHPQRWTNNRAQWWSEFIGQSAKNIAKRILCKLKSEK